MVTIKRSPSLLHNESRQSVSQTKKQHPVRLNPQHLATFVASLSEEGLEGFMEVLLDLTGDGVFYLKSQRFEVTDLGVTTVVTIGGKPIGNQPAIFTAGNDIRIRLNSEGVRRAFGMLPDSASIRAVREVLLGLNGGRKELYLDGKLVEICQLGAERMATLRGRVILGIVDEGYIAARSDNWRNSGRS